MSYETALVKVTNTYLPMITNTLEYNGIQMSDYQRQCVLSAINQISNALEAKDKTFHDVDQRSLTEALTLTATLQLNPSATPREIYYIIRNKKVGDKWISAIEAGIEGDGNDALLARFGRDIKTVHKYWEVKEQDEFIYPEYSGLELTPPKWRPTGKGRVIRVVYPITKTNGEVEYLIAEREDVVKNLIAHIKNNLMNETFDIVENRYKATAAQKKQIDDKKKEVLALIGGKDIDAILSMPELEAYISPAWKEEQSRESMIVRKMRNNIVKKYPKNFENAFLERVYTETTDEAFKSMRKDVTENANQELIDFPKDEDETKTKTNESETVIVDPETGEIIEDEPVAETVNLFDGPGF